MTEEVLQLGYRELAERLGISPDAARMKAKRAVKAGRWRIIPGNHPSDRVLIEIPAAELNETKRVGGDQLERVPRRTQGRTPERMETDAITGQMVAALQSAQDRIRELTDQLTEEKDRHKETAMGLIQAETVQANAALEIDRLQITIAELQAELGLARRSWWKRMTGRS